MYHEQFDFQVRRTVTLQGLHIRIYLDLLHDHVAASTVVRRFSVVAGASVGLGVCSVVKTRPCGGS